MGLFEDKQMADLQQKLQTLYKPRSERIAEVKSDSIRSITSSFQSFLERENFTVSVDPYKFKLTGIYKDQIQLALEFPKPEDQFANFTLSYSKGNSLNSTETCKFLLRIKQDDVPSWRGGVGTRDSLKAAEMEFIQEHTIPALERLKTSDITGDYTLSIVPSSTGNTRSSQLAKNPKMKEHYSDFESLLNDFIS